ncbi:hypothetical protein IC615_20295 [Serratia ureilytica]
MVCDTPLVGYRANPNGITRAPKRRDLDDPITPSSALTAGVAARGKGFHSVLFVTTLKARLLVGLDFFGLRDALREPPS